MSVLYIGRISNLFGILYVCRRNLEHVRVYMYLYTCHMLLCDYIFTCFVILDIRDVVKDFLRMFYLSQYPNNIYVLWFLTNK